MESKGGATPSADGNVSRSSRESRWFTTGSWIFLLRSPWSMWCSRGSRSSREFPPTFQSGLLSVAGPRELSEKSSRESRLSRASSLMQASPEFRGLELHPISDDKRSSKASSVSPVGLVSVKKSRESSVCSGERKAGGRTALTLCPGPNVSWWRTWGKKEHTSIKIITTVVCGSVNKMLNKAAEIWGLEVPSSCR